MSYIVLREALKTTTILQCTGRVEWKHSFRLCSLQRFIVFLALDFVNGLIKVWWLWQCKYKLKNSSMFFFYFLKVIWKLLHKFCHTSVYTTGYQVSHLHTLKMILCHLEPYTNEFRLFNVLRFDIVYVYVFSLFSFRAFTTRQWQYFRSLLRISCPCASNTLCLTSKSCSCTFKRHKWKWPVFFLLGYVEFLWQI